MKTKEYQGVLDKLRLIADDLEINHGNRLTNKQKQELLVKAREILKSAGVENVDKPSKKVYAHIRE